MGDGVNIAARLEGVAEPGAICLSEDAYRQVRAGSISGQRSRRDGAQEYRRAGARLRAPGRRRLGEAVAAGLARQAASRAAPQPASPSIAVLPFANMSGDAEQEYFADGISEDIITALSKLSQLFVIARNSSFTFKGKNVHVGEVGKSLGVRYVLEGSVRKSGAGSDHRAAHRRDDRRASVGGTVRPRAHRHFAVQDDVTAHIVSALALNLSASDRKASTASTRTIRRPTIASCAGARFGAVAEGRPRGRGCCAAPRTRPGFAPPLPSRCGARRIAYRSNRAFLSLKKTDEGRATRQ